MKQANSELKEAAQQLSTDAKNKAAAKKQRLQQEKEQEQADQVVHVDCPRLQY